MPCVGATVPTDPSVPVPLRAVTAVQLRGSSFELPFCPLGAEQWAELARGASIHRCWGLVAGAIRSGALQVTSAQREETEAASRSAAALQVELDVALVEVANALDQLGTDYRVLKGPATSRAFYDDPQYRQYVDIDLLIRASHLDRAIEVLLDLGTSRPQLGGDANAWGDPLGWGQPVRLPTGVEIDIHRTLRPGPFGLRIETDELFEGPATVTIGGREILTLDADLHFIHACYHAVLHGGPPALVPLLDVAIALDSDLVDPDRVVTTAERWMGGAVIARAINEATTIFALETGHPLVRFGRRRRPRRIERRWITTYGSTSPRNHLRRPLALLEAQNHWTERLRMMRSIVRHADADPFGVRIRRSVTSVLGRPA